MAATIASERCFEYVDAHARRMNKGVRGSQPDTGLRVITISREAGSGAHAVADALIERLQAHASGTAIPWKVFDRELVEEVLEQHDLPERMAEFMAEDRMSAIADTLDELFGLHPSSSSLVRKTADTILHLAELGNAIIIGRAGSIVARHVSGAFHVRLVGSRDRRIAHTMSYHELTRDEATDYVMQHDLGRKRYVEKYYSRDIEDPLLYHVVMNTDRLGYEGAARLISDAALTGAASPGSHGSRGATLTAPEPASAHAV